jgi:exodeoxyribonuclease VII small subunit
VDRGGPSELDRVPAGEPTFAEARAELEAIVGRLERGEAELEEAVALWERGEELYRLCLSKLDAASGLVEELGRDGAVRPVATGPAPDEPAGAEPAPSGDG